MSFGKVRNFLVNFFAADMNGNDTHSYRFNSFVLDVAERQISHNGKPVPLTPKAFDVLVFLVEHSGHLVLKDELMQAVWPDAFVDEVNLPRTIHTLRRTFGEDENGNKLIETVPTKGYRFVAEVERVSANGADLPIYKRTGDAIEKGLAGLDTHSVDGSANGPRVVEPETFRRSRPRTVLIVAIAVIVMGSGIASLLAFRSSQASAGLPTSRVQTNNGEAYQHYQQGRLSIERGYGGGKLEDALASFEKAIELDPNYAAAYAGKADAKMQIFWTTAKNDDIAEARSAINQAIELDESNSYAHTILCRLKGTHDWDFKGAEGECRRAIELDPKDHEARREIAFYLSAFGREDEAMREIDAAVELAPTSFNKRSRGMILYFSRRYDEAIEQLLQVEETDPNEYDTRRWLTNAYEMKKDYRSAMEARVRQMVQEEATPDHIAAVRAAFEKSGWSGVLIDIVNSKRPYMATATAYAQLGELDMAFESLERLNDRRGIMMIHIAREPRLDPLRNDPRFDDLLKRVGLK